MLKPKKLLRRFTGNSDSKISLSRRRPLFESLENRSLLAAVAAPEGIVSWWAGDGTSTDLIGPNDAALFNGVAYAAGQVR